MVFVWLFLIGARSSVSGEVRAEREESLPEPAQSHLVSSVSGEFRATYSQPDSRVSWCELTSMHKRKPILSHVHSVSLGPIPIISPCWRFWPLPIFPTQWAAGILTSTPVLLSMGLEAHGALLNANCTPVEILTSPVRLYVTLIYSCLIFGCCYTFPGFPCGSDGNESACSAGDPGSIPGSGRFPGKGNGKSHQYSYVGNPMNRGAWRATVCGVTKTRTQLRD